MSVVVTVAICALLLFIPAMCLYENRDQWRR